MISRLVRYRIAPCGVGLAPPRLRSSNLQRYFASSARSCWLTADCVMKFCEAATEKLPVSTTSQNTFRVSICITPANPTGERNEVKALHRDGVHAGRPRADRRPRRAADKRCGPLAEHASASLQCAKNRWEGSGDEADSAPPHVDPRCRRRALGEVLRATARPRRH